MSGLSQVKNFIEYIIFLILEKFISTPISSESNSILFVNTGQIGDLIVSSILLENPDVFVKYEKIYFVIKEKYLELFTDYNGKIKFIGYNPIKYKLLLIYKIKFLNELRSNGINKCYNLTAARGIINDEITLLSAAREKYCLNNNIRYLGKYLGAKLNKRYSKVLFKNVDNEYEKHFQLLKILNGGYITKINFYNKYTFNVHKPVSIGNSNFDDDLILVAPISSEQNRDWPINYFKQLVKLLGNQFSLILLGTKRQKRSLQKIRGNISNVTLLAGELKLNDLASLIFKANLFIGLDSGLTHLALKLGNPVVAIIGGGFYQKFFPYKESSKVRYLYNKMDCFGCEWNCIYDKKHCIEDISEDEVFREVEKILHPEKA